MRAGTRRLLLLTVAVARPPRAVDGSANAAQLALAAAPARQPRAR